MEGASGWNWMDGVDDGVDDGVSDGVGDGDNRKSLII